MFLETGYVYHIKDEYFEFTKDEKLMKMEIQDLHIFV